MPKVPYPYLWSKLQNGSLIPICSLSNPSLLPSLTLLLSTKKFSALRQFVLYLINTASYNFIMVYKFIPLMLVPVTAFFIAAHLTASTITAAATATCTSTVIPARGLWLVWQQQWGRFFMSNDLYTYILGYYIIRLCQYSLRILINFFWQFLLVSNNSNTFPGFPALG